MRFHLVFPLLLALLSVAHGRTCRILFLSAPDGAPEKLHLHDGKSSREVELPRMNLSPVYQLPPGDLTLRMLTTAAAAGTLVDPAAPSAKVGTAISDFYLLVSPDPANRVAPVKLQVINASPDTLRRGQILWFNLTPNQVGGRLGERQLAMEPHSRTVIDNPAPGDEDYEVNLTYRIPGNPRLYPLCETKWHHDPASRGLFFILVQPGNRTPRVLGFPDCRPEPKPGR